MAKDGKHPPLIQQFIENQLKYPDAIVATEVGGFFEIWQVDDIGYAFKASQLLDTVLTRRNKSDPNSPYMTGFPSHAAHGYFKKLVDLGETVVLVEQNIRGTKADGNKNVTREITKILSPGTVIENLKDSQNNYFASVYVEESFVGVCLLDISTGEVVISEMNLQESKDFLDKMSPKEILITGNCDFSFDQKQLVHRQAESLKIKNLNQCGKLLAKVYDIKNPTSNENYSIISLGIEMWRLGVISLGNLLNYLTTTDYNSKLLKKINKPNIYNIQEHLTIPNNGFLSLEVFENASRNEFNTLFSVLDECKTSMGKRKLRQWLKTPLSNKEKILKRQDKVSGFLEKKNFYEELKDVYDIARISRKLVLSNLMPHEISQLYQSLSIIEELVVNENKQLGEKLKKIKNQIAKNIDTFLASSYTDKSDYNFFKGNLLTSVEKQLSLWKQAQTNMDLFIDKLSIEFDSDNFKIVEKSDSYYLYCNKGLKQKLEKSHYKYEEQATGLRILNTTWEDLSSICYGKKANFLQECEKSWKFFQQQLLISWGKELLEIAEVVGEVDVLTTFAKQANDRGYSKPNFIDTTSAGIDFKNLRHPVVELSKNLKEGFVANSVELNSDKNTLVIYGANSAGKSTILKSVALNIIMAQIGSYIAAEENSSLTVFESILTRMSSFDSLSEGLSTFTMEMTELQIALQFSQKKSIFLFDEIGRGTSVEDGEALAYSTLVYLDKPENKCITLFATHYHGLYENIKEIKRIEVKHVHCYSNEKGNLVFSRKLIEGIGNGSYGIEVAKSCGIPVELIRIAERYSKTIHQLKNSRYNSNVQETNCPICLINPAQETHHIIEQHQGKVKEITINGSKKSINHQSNLLMICSSCHEKITRKTIEVKLIKELGTADAISIEINNKRKDG